MAKDPAFLFYPGDWMGGTQWMTMEQKGCYMELLILQFNTGGFTEAQAKQVLSICFDVAWATIKQKFKFDNGVYINERLHGEIERRKVFTESRRINGLSKKESKKQPEAYAKHMETENETINNNNKGVKKIKKQQPPPTLDQVKEYFKEKGYTETSAITAFNYYSTADWVDSKGNKVLNWKQKMIAVWFKPENKKPESQKARFVA